MKISAFLKIKINRLIILIISWTIVSIVFFVYEYYAVRLHAPDVAAEINVRLFIFINLYAGVLGGILGGPFLIFSVSKKTRNRPFYYGLIYTALGFLLVYIIISSSISAIVFSINLKSPIYSKEVLSQTINNMLAIWQIKNLIIWMIIISTTQFILQINDKFGPGNLWKFISGKYYNPKEEERIFMFLDLKSATSIAENIGHTLYYNLLNDFYAVITDPIINHLGEIYQYVGDEIVVSWESDKVINNDYCISCFFEIKRRIQQEKEKFTNLYGIIPEFKAGMHCGLVTVGEIGVMKRDIVYSGDVLNTTSRIQESCNIHNSELLVSEDVISLLSNLESYQIDNIGEISLKGKAKKINVASVKQLANRN
jgi:adenylate cyclase